MKIEFWLDYLCPKCYLQHQVIENMVKAYDIHDLEVVYRSYEMLDHELFDDTQDYEKFVATYKKMDISEVHDFLDKEDLHINLFKIHDVHRMAHLAKKKDLSLIFNHLVFEAIYQDRLDLSQKDILMQVALNAGLQKSDIEEVLLTNKFSNQVISNRENAQLKGIYDLPFLRINGQTKLKGLQSEQSLINALNQSFIQMNESEFCEGEHCVRKKRK